MVHTGIHQLELYKTTEAFKFRIGTLILGSPEKLNLLSYTLVSGATSTLLASFFFSLDVIASERFPDAHWQTVIHAC
jgi:hypothetical protein